MITSNSNTTATPTIHKDSPEYQARTKQIITEILTKYAFITSMKRLVLRENPLGKSFDVKSWDLTCKQYYSFPYVDEQGSTKLWYPTFKTMELYLHDFYILSIGCLPASGPIYKDADGHLVLNLWKPPVFPEKTQYRKPAWFIEYLSYLSGGDEVVINELMGFLAHLVQKPAEKVKHGIIITSKPHGVGKSTLGVIAGKLVGRAASQISSVQLKSQFNSWLQGKTVIVVDEIYEGNNKDISNQLKPYITQETISVEAKGRDLIEVNNYARFFMFSNNPKPLSIDAEDRRYFVYDCSSLSKRSEEYWKELYSKINDV